MEQGAVFQKIRSQSVRLPNAATLAEDVKRVDAAPIGQAQTITPAGESWASWFDGDGATADFMAEREQPGCEVR